MHARRKTNRARRCVPNTAVSSIPRRFVPLLRGSPAYRPVCANFNVAPESRSNSHIHNRGASCVGGGGFGILRLYWVRGLPVYAQLPKTTGFRVLTVEIPRNTEILVLLQESSSKHTRKAINGVNQTTTTTTARTDHNNSISPKNKETHGRVQKAIDTAHIIPARDCSGPSPSFSAGRDLHREAVLQRRTEERRSPPGQRGESARVLPWPESLRVCSVFIIFVCGENKYCLYQVHRLLVCCRICSPGLRVTQGRIKFRKEGQGVELNGSRDVGLCGVGGYESTATINRTRGKRVL